MKPVRQYQEPFDSTTIPDDVIIQEWKRRREALRHSRGKFFLQKKYVTCPHCKTKGSTREMRDHVCPKAPQGPLTTAQVKKLREEAASGKISLVQLALNYGISVMNAWLVVNNRIHKKKAS